MLNFNNTLTSKIISLTIAVLFLLAGIGYAGVSQEGALRVPVGEGATYKRIIEAEKGQSEQGSLDQSQAAIVRISKWQESIKSMRFAFRLSRAFLQRARGQSIIPYADLENKQIFDERGRRYTLHVKAHRGKFYILADADEEVKTETGWQLRPGIGIGSVGRLPYAELIANKNTVAFILVQPKSILSSLAAIRRYVISGDTQGCLKDVTIIALETLEELEGAGIMRAVIKKWARIVPQGAEIIIKDIVQEETAHALLEGKDFWETAMGHIFGNNGLVCHPVSTKRRSLDVVLFKEAAASAPVSAKGSLPAIDQDTRADNMTQNFKADSSVTDAQTITLNNLRNHVEIIELKRKKEETGKGWVYVIVLKDGLVSAGQGRLLAESWITLKETENSLKVFDIHLGEGDFSEVSQGRGSTIIRFLADYAFKKGKLLQIIGTNNYGLIKLCHDYISAEARYQQDDGRILTFSELQEGIEKVFLGFVHPVYSGIMMSLDFTWSKGDHQELKYFSSGEEFEDNIGQQMVVTNEAGKIIACWRDTIQPFPPYQVYIPLTKITIIMQPGIQGKSYAIKAPRQVGSSL